MHDSTAALRSAPDSGLNTAAEVKDERVALEASFIGGANVAPNVGINEMHDTITVFVGVKMTLILFFPSARAENLNLRKETTAPSLQFVCWSIFYQAKHLHPNDAVLSYR